MKSIRILAALAIAAASTAAFADGGGSRGGVYPVPAAAASHVAVANSGFGGAVSTTSEAGSKGVSHKLTTEQTKLFAHH